MAKYTIGLDLGQAQDYSALVIVEKITPLPVVRTQPVERGDLQLRYTRQENQTTQPPARYDVREIRRWPLGTSYPQIVTDVTELCALPLLADAALVVDATGVGRPIVDLFKVAGCRPNGVLITAGTHATRDPDTGYWHIPKKELVSTVQIGLQSGTLQIARALPEAATLTEELLNFQVKITAAANEIYGAWRTGLHDDIVLGLALALWYAERKRVDTPEPRSGGYRSWDLPVWR